MSQRCNRSCFNNCCCCCSLCCSDAGGGGGGSGTGLSSVRRGHHPCLSAFRYWIHQTFFMPIKMPVVIIYKWWPARYSFIICFALYLVLAVGLPPITLRQTVYDLNENLNFKLVVWHLLTVFACVFLGFFCIEWREESLNHPDCPYYYANGNMISTYNGDGSAFNGGGSGDDDDDDDVNHRESGRQGVNGVITGTTNTMKTIPTQDGDWNGVSITGE